MRKPQTCQDTSMHSALYSVGSPIQFRENTHSKYILSMDIYTIIESKKIYSVYLTVVESGHDKHCFKSVFLTRLRSFFLFITRVISLSCPLSHFF